MRSYNDFMKKIFESIWSHVKAFVRGVLGIFGVHYSTPPFERIVFVCGINTFGKRVKPFIAFLESHFPQVEVVLIQEFYLHHQAEKVERMIELTTEALLDEKKTLVIGHSFGGIVARAALARLENVSHVLLLATLGSPHRIKDFGVAEALMTHDVPERCRVPVLTFGGRADAVVPDEFSTMDGAVGHVTISCTHIAFLRVSRTRKEVLAAIMQYLHLRA